VEVLGQRNNSDAQIAGIDRRQEAVEADDGKCGVLFPWGPVLGGKLSKYEEDNWQDVGKWVLSVYQRVIWVQRWDRPQCFPWIRLFLGDDNGSKVLLRDLNFCILISLFRHWSRGRRLP
jgi:hypothetical protein